MSSLSVRKRGKGWEYRFDTAKIDGKRKQVSKAGFKTKSEALAAGTKALNEYNNTGFAFTPSEIGVADYMKYWLTSYVEKNLAYNTYAGYKRYIEIHIIPAFGMYKLSALSNNPAAIQDWITDLKIRGYSRSMISNLLGCLSSALNYAVLPCKYISSNPCTYVKVPKIIMSKEDREHKEYVCSRENFENNIISINHQLSKQNDRWCLISPKYNSVRTLKMDNFLNNALKKEYLNQRKNMLKYGEYYIKTYISDNNVVIQLPASIDCQFRQIMPATVRENGELLTPDSFKYCARVVHHELNNINFHYHCLRHTHGTLLAEAGINPRTVMERLGHKDISTTLQTYTFNTQKMQDAAVEVFEKIAHK